MDFNTAAAEQTVGIHEGAIRCVEFCAAIGKLLWIISIIITVIKFSPHPPFILMIKNVH